MLYITKSGFKFDAVFNGIENILTRTLYWRSNHEIRHRIHAYFSTKTERLFDFS